MALSDFAPACNHLEAGGTQRNFFLPRRKRELHTCLGSHGRGVRADDAQLRYSGFLLDGFDNAQS